ncbi:hypothetical protein E2605_07545 [Dysgonomonas capnocytophagoides]|uniref:Tape measure protein N-terminal domain-containing protein n=1 Tax=Dysgonomonas capnocytophagoides TaxID=45254 RepID=A0A4Y8L3C6_9BACT|nr:tape measure protein [Dysgonomonas capnocytophagoides]TFD96664.1 hypothetical protein E2605_07545 [Dysgonomonas capnocytophagoides]
MANSAINISANAQEVINLRKRIDELKAALSSMRQSADPKAYNKLNSELQTTSIRYYRLIGDIQRYTVAQQQAERATSKSSDSLTDLLKKGAALAGVTFGAEKIRELGMEIIKVHGEMQQLDIAFSTMLKSQEKADALMSGLKTFATDTPFGLMDSAKGAKQLLAYGTTAENIIGDLKMLGNVASGVSAPLGDIVYLYGTLRSQGRAYAVDIRQFAGRGIPIYAELAKVLKVNVDQVNELVSAGKVGFPEVEQAFKNMTSGGGMFEGLMEKQTASVTGQIEKLKDNIQFMFDAIGTSSEGAIYGAIDGASTLVENYQAVGEALTALIATYGTYKAILIADTAIQGVRTSAMYTAEAAELSKLLTVEQAANVSKQNLTKGTSEYVAAIKAEIATAAESAQTKLAEQQADLNALMTKREQAREQMVNSQAKVQLLKQELAQTIVNTQAEIEASLKKRMAVESEKQSRAALSIVRLQERKDAAIEQARALKEQEASAEKIAAKNREIASIQAKIAVARQEEIQHGRNVAAARAELKAGVDLSANKAVQTATTNLNTATQQANSAATQYNTLQRRYQVDWDKVQATQQAVNTAVTNANTVATSANITVTQLLTAAKAKLWTATKNLFSVLVPNPYILVAAAVIGAGYAIYKYATYTTEAEKAIIKFNEEARNQINELNGVFDAYKKANEGTEEKKKLLEIIKTKYGDYIKSLIDEKGRINDVEAAQRMANQALKESIALKIKNDSITETTTKEVKKQANALSGIRDIITGQDRGDEVANMITSRVGEIFSDETKSLEDITKEAYDFLRNNDVYRTDRDGAIGKTVDSYILDLLKSAKRLRSEKKDIENSFKGLIQGDPINVYVPDRGDLSETKSYVEWEKQYNKELKDLQKERKSIENNDAKLSEKALKKKLEDIDSQIKMKQDQIKDLTTKTPKQQDQENSKAETAAEKRLEAQRKIDESDRQRQSEKLAFDNEMRQKSIDNMEDGFDKQSALLKLNYDKDIQAIEEYKDKMSKAQYTEAKNQYTSKHGDDKGFEGYFSSLKGEDLSKIMPSGLRSKDITANVNAYTKAANEAFDKGGRDINKNIALIMQEERLAFASELDQRLASVRSHFKDQKKAVESASKDWIELNNLENQAIETVKAEHNTKLIQMDNEYKEKAIEISTDLFFFQSDKDAALLKQKIANNDKYINALKKEFTVQTKLDYDTLDEDALDNLAKQYPDIVYAIRRAKQEQNGFNKEIAKTPAQKLKELKSLFDDISGVVGDITGVDFSMISNAIGGIASFAEKDYIGAASSGIGILSTAISGMVSQSAKHAAIQAEIVKLQQQYNIDLRQQNFDLVESINYARAFRQNLEALNWLVEKGFISDVDYSAWDALNEQYKIAQDNFDKASKSYEDYIKGSEDWLKSIDNEAYLRYNKDARGILEDWKNGVIDTEEAIKRMAETTNIGDLRDQINSAKEETDKWKDEIVDLSKQMDEFATGTEFDSFLSDAMSAMQDMKSGVADLADFTENSLKNAVLSSFKYKVLSNALEPMYNQLADLFLADTLDKDAVSKWGVDLESLLGEYADKLEEVYKSLGLDFSDSSTSQSASSGYSTSMSQDTGEAIEGRMTAMQMNLISIDGNVARIAEWAQPFDMKYNVDVLTAPLSALSESCQRIELMLEQNRNIAIQSYYELKDINKQTKELYPMRIDTQAIRKSLESL